MADDKQLIAGAAQTWPEFQLSLQPSGLRCEIKTSVDGEWIMVNHEAYRMALETMKLSAMQDIAEVLARISDQLERKAG